MAKSKGKTRSKSKKVSKSKKRLWIQEAKFTKGSTRDYVRRKYGDKGFTSKGTLKISVLEEIAKDPNVQLKTRRKAQAALNLKRLPRRKKRR